MMDEIRFAEAIEELSHEIAKLGNGIQNTNMDEHADSEWEIITKSITN